MKPTEYAVEGRPLNHVDPKSGGGKSVLIFPGGMPRSLEYLENSLRDGRSVKDRKSVV